MTPATEPEDPTELDLQFFKTWNQLKHREDEWYVGYIAAGLLAAVSCYIFIGLHSLLGVIDLAAAGILAAWWHQWLPQLRHRSRELWAKRHPEETPSS